MAATPSLKRLQIDKANQVMFLVIAIGTFLTIFSLISSKTLYTQLTYQNKVAGAKEIAVRQLKADVVANQQLVTSYKNFVNTPTNLLSGSSTGTGPTDGDNAKIVLDSLPSQYDYPALTASIQYFLDKDAVNIDSISGADQQATVAPSTNVSSSAAAAAAAAAPATTTTTTQSLPGTTVAMPFGFSVDAPYASIQSLLGDFQKSIRPMEFQTLDFNGQQSDLTLTATAQSFFQPEKDFTITSEKIH